MYSSAKAWWMRDTALHSFIFTQFLVGLPFFVFGTYALYQTQNVGYVIGHDGNGGPCETYCIVPWAGLQLDLNAVLLYLNAFIFGLGGVVTLILSAYSDYWQHKHLLVTGAIVLYGAFSLPAYWLQDYTLQNFQILSALNIIFQIVTLVMMAILSIYIPHCMRGVQTSAVANELPSSVLSTPVVPQKCMGVKRKYGFNMSLFGMIANGVGGTVVFVIVIILTQTLSGTAAQSSGLLLSTIIGFITIAGSSVAYFGLPTIPSKPISQLKHGWFGPIIELFMPLKELAVRKNMAALLVSYTIYTDALFAISSASTQLFIAEIRPGALEFSLYSLTQSLLLLGCSLGFLWIQPFFRTKLETWYITGLGLVMLIPVWACIGLADVNFGFKMRWEFYVQLFVFQLSGAFANASFRVLLAELIPIGSEIRWFGMQLVLSCGTVWVNYVASGPLQNATHQLRFPMVLSLIVLAIAFGVEVCRVTLQPFKKDLVKWRNLERNGTIDESIESSSTDEQVQYTMVDKEMGAIAR